MAVVNDFRTMIDGLVRAAMPVREAVVTNVANYVGTGFCEVDWGSGPIVVSTTEAYGDRALGDRVLVLRSLSGNWHVLSQVESPPAAAAVVTTPPVVTIPPIPKVQIGVLTVTPTANTVLTTSIVFPTPFATVPTVQVTPQSGVPQNVDVGALNITVNGFDLSLYRTTGASTTLSWLAATANA